PNDLPWKFEAGTSNIEGGIGLGAAIDYLNSVGMSKIREHEKRLTLYGLEKLSKIKNVELFGYQKKGIEKRGGVISFSIKGIHPHDVAAVFDSYGIAIRAGHHCAMPLVKGIFKEGALSRISFYLYNEEKDVDAAVEAIYAVKKIFKVR
ncbi:aminotransferase class V-fold PLP-dependent enzyme, partial [Candidatus Marsarchaeota archaeon]|nr:aminotransferase class V-fold PLP-dependent enzyme [Candidatus Marsarchaeota archaeon]